MKHQEPKARCCQCDSPQTAALRCIVCEKPMCIWCWEKYPERWCSGCAVRAKFEFPDIHPSYRLTNLAILVIRRRLGYRTGLPSYMEPRD